MLSTIGVYFQFKLPHSKDTNRGFLTTIDRFFSTIEELISFLSRQHGFVSSGEKKLKNISSELFLYLFEIRTLEPQQKLLGEIVELTTISEWLIEIVPIIVSHYNNVDTLYQLLNETIVKYELDQAFSYSPIKKDHLAERCDRLKRFLTPFAGNDIITIASIELI